MSEPAAILATFSDLKLVKTRKVAQLVFEVPIESVRSATEALGWPTGEQWCGIARVTKSAGGAAIHPNGGDGHGPGSRLEALPAKPFGDARNREDGGAGSTAVNPSPKPNSTRAVMMAKDEEFRRFLSEANNWSIVNEPQADLAIKTLCKVKSKADLNDLPGAAMFDALRRDFHFWRKRQPYNASMRGVA